jgi:hypothetical protein
MEVLKRLRSLTAVAAILAATTLAACGGSKGDPAAAPTNVAVKAGDGRVTVTFNGQAGVDYWIFFAPGTGLTVDSWVNLPGAGVQRNAVSPAVISGLRNGQIYSFTINGRTQGGPGGPASATLSATPRLAGAEWVAGTSLDAAELRGAAFGSPYVLVGTGGKIFSSPITDGRAYTALTSGTTGIAYIAVGADGTVVGSSDAAATWATRTSGTTATLNSIAVGSGRFVAVGNGGTIVTSTDGTTFTPATSGTTANLRRVTFSSLFVAVGDGGVILTSSDGLTWTAATSNTTATLRALALGDDGALVTSPDGTTWTARPSIGPVNVRSATVASQGVAVGAGGAIYTSADGLAWTAQNSGSSANLLAVMRATFGYVAVGSGGVVLSSE